MKQCVLLAGLSVCVSLQSAGAEPSTPQYDTERPVLSPIAPSVDPARLYDERYTSENYREAVEAAKQLINEVIARGGDDSAYADALEKLARAQRMSGEISAAIQNFRSAIERIESTNDMLAADLVAPLTGLARSLADNLEYNEAVAEYQRAAHISRVNEGPMNLAQCEILAELVDLHVDQSLFDEAVDFQTYQLTIYRRSLDETDPRVLDAWRRNGELLSLSGEHVRAQEHYVYAMDNIRVADGPDSLAQLPFLYDLSDSYLNHANADRFTRIEMARAQLERAISLTESNTNSTPRLRSDAYLRMGDFMQRFGESRSALHHYRRAWKQMFGDDALRQATFGQPSILNPPPSPRATGIPGQSETVTTITVTYDVDHRGHVDNIRIQDDSLNDAAEKKALMLTRKLVFRPRFDAGEPVTTHDLVRDIDVLQ